MRAESASARDGHGHVDVYGDGDRDGSLDADVDVYVDEDVDGDVATHVAHPMQLTPLYPPPQCCSPKRARGCAPGHNPFNSNIKEGG